MAEVKGKSSIGIDFTGDHVNLVRLVRKGKSVDLVEARSIKLAISPKAQEAQEEVNTALQEGLHKALEGIDFSKDVISLGIGGHMGFVRKVKLPPISQSKVPQIVSYEVQQQIPFSLNEVIWNYQIVSPPSKTPVPVEVLMSASKTNFVDSLLRNMTSAIKREPDIIDVSVLALHNCLFFNKQLPKEEPLILIHSGYNYTDISVEINGELVFTRTLPFGGKTFLGTIAKSRKVDMGKAEQILESEDVFSILESDLQNIVTEVKRTTNYYLSTVEKITSFKKIFLCGEIAKIKGFAEFLKSSFQSEVSKLNPFKEINQVSSQIPNLANLGVSTGLALRGLMPASVELNLLPVKVIKKKEFSRKRPYFLLSFFLLILIGATLLMFDKQYNKLNKAKLARVDAIIKSYKPHVVTIKDLKEERKKITRKLEEMENILQNKNYWSGILLEISRLTPSKVCINTIFPGKEDAGGELVKWNNNGNEVICLKGNTHSRKDVEEYKEILSASPLFKNVLQSSLKSEEEGKLKFAFELEVVKP